MQTERNFKGFPAKIREPNNKSKIGLEWLQEPGWYTPFTNPEVIAQIKDGLQKGVAAFWVADNMTKSLHIIDLEAMQSHNVNTGVCVPIRLVEENALCIMPIMWTSDCISDGDFEARNPMVLEQSPVPVPMTQGATSCGPVARRMLTRIRFMHVRLSRFVQNMAQKPVHEQLFDPTPMSHSDPAFPSEQIKFLQRPGVTVHAVRPTRLWRRHRTYFDLLLAEEQKLYNHNTDTGVVPKLKHFAWHGAPVRCIRGILDVGFLVTPTPRVGNMFGHGVYLATEQNARYSLSDQYSKPDGQGFKYLLLCEVLPGTVEVSKRGQFRPADASAHSGVDQLPDASMHIFYSNDMNVRISPKFMVCVHPAVPLYICQFLFPKSASVASLLSS